MKNRNKFHLHTAFIIFLFIGLLNSSDSFSQNTDQQMAQYYFDNGEFEKAKLYYEKIFQEQTSSSIYNNYISTLLELNEYKEAEKITKKQIKRQPRGSFYDVKLGEIYEKSGEKEKAEKYFKKLIDEMSEKNNPDEYNSLCNEFVRLLKYNLAIQTLEKCDEIHPNTNFNITIANLYGMQGNFEKMIDSYLFQIEKKPSELERVKAFLPRSIDFIDDKKTTELLRVRLLKKIQRNPENESFYDLLIWIYQQTDDFESAYIHVKAYDKRTKAKGEKIYKFAQLCVSNKKYDLAIEAYENVIDKYQEINYFVIASKQEILLALQNKIFSNSNYTQIDVKNLKKRYLLTISEVVEYENKLPLMEGLAYLEGFYSHNIDTAEKLYNELLSYPGISKKRKALNKIRLGDIYMLKNEIWDASLLYMQVEKEFKYDIIGFEAKFKNAKLYYYNADFEWSQNQLDGLKASTSKLISNDAIDLSLLITDNYNMDTTLLNMKQFAKADLFIFQNKLALAEKTLDSITEREPTHSLVDEILFKKYEIAFKKQDFEKAKQFLQKIINEHTEEILADNSLFKLAELEENQLNNKKAAYSLYEKLLFDYPGSLFVVESRKRYREYATEFGESKQINSFPETKN